MLPKLCWRSAGLVNRGGGFDSCWELVGTCIEAPPLSDHNISGRMGAGPHVPIMARFGVGSKIRFISVFTRVRFPLSLLDI